MEFERPYKREWRVVNVMSNENDKFHKCDDCGFEIPTEDVDRFVLGTSDVCYDCYLESKSYEFEELGWEDEMADF